MAQSKRPSFLKRQKEMRRREKQKKKAEKRDMRKVEKEDRPQSDFQSGDDIAHIIPGPQPLLGP